MRIWRIKAERDPMLRRAIYLSLDLVREYAQKVCEQSGQKVTIYEEITTYVPQVMAREEEGADA